MSGGSEPRTRLRMGGLVLERWIVGLLGIWTLALAFLVPGHRVVAWSDLLAGLAVAVTGALMTRRGHGVRGFLAVILGVVLAVGSLLPGLHVGDGLAASGLVVGLAIALVGFGPYGRA